ncbi:MAG: BMP family ABC transporter substrate-binding protein [Desulfovibrio sp.]|nr:BMP family ABC transporter substrate-binding protein [Desulfovibrio sp.]
MPCMPCRPYGVYAVLALLHMFLASPLQASVPESAVKPLRAALLLEHDGGDWAGLLRAGLVQAGRKFSVTVEVMSESLAEEQETLFHRAAREFDLVIVASDRFHEILRNNAANYRKTLFGCVDAGVRAPNIMSVTFADEQAACLAGAAAAMLTVQTGLPGVNSKKVLGWLAGEDVPAMRSLINGFTDGARLIDPEMRVINAFSGSFSSRGRAREETQRLLDAGCDVLVLAAGTGNAEALSLAGGQGCYLVGMDENRDALLPGRVLTSIVKRADRAVYDIVSAAASGRFRGKEIIVYDLANNGVGITDMARFKASAGRNFPDDMDRRLAELRKELVSGGIQIKSLRARTLCDCL